MAVSIPRSADHLFTQAKKVDDLALQVVAKSLPSDTAELISKRLLYDYLADVGAIGILRRFYLENFDLNNICKLYWGSRREIGNPNFESILAQLLINISASFIYDQIKALHDAGILTQQWMSLRGILVTAGFFTPSEFVQNVEHARLLYSLYRLKQTPAGSETASSIVKRALSEVQPSQIELDGEADIRGFEIILENMRVISRGVLIDSIRDTGHSISIPAGGLVLQGSTGSAGIGWGKPIAAADFLSSKPLGDNVIAMNSRELDNEAAASALYLSTGVITSDGVSGHVPVLARGVGRPCVAHIPWKKQQLSNFSFAIVDGNAGSVRLFVDRPAGYPTLSGKRSYYKREGD
jgi:hypothetical protein